MDELNSLEVGSVAELVQAISSKELLPDSPDLPAWPLWFRGQCRAEWALQPSIFRGAYRGRDEYDLSHRFRTRARVARHDAPSYSDYPAWLSLMHHHGLPTRLLDWSRSPLIAAFFALRPYLEFSNASAIGEAAVWVLAPLRMNRRLADNGYTPAINSHSCGRLVEGAFSGIDQDASDRKSPEAMAVMPSESDMRIFVQQGCFTIHASPTSVEDMAGAETFLCKLVIPAEASREFANEINTCGVREGDIFPELEHLSSELKDTVTRIQFWSGGGKVPPVGL